MARRVRAFGICMALFATTAAAQTPAVPSTVAPAVGNSGHGIGGRGPAVVSPEVRADGTVTLRFLAPNATQVTVSGELDGKSHPMTKGADGVWSVTIGPLAPEFIHGGDSRKSTYCSGLPLPSYLLLL